MRSRALLSAAVGGMAVPYCAVLRLYRIPLSTHCERVALALAHKRVECEPVWVDPDDRDVVERLSGQRLVPVVEHDGRVLAGSLAILRHVDEAWPDPPLWPSGEARSAEVDVFVDWFDRVWRRAPDAIWAELEKPEPDAARIAKRAGHMRAALALFERMLAGRDHLMGDELTAADLCAFPFLKFALLGREGDSAYHRILDEHQPIDGHPRLAAWIERMDARPRA